MVAEEFSIFWHLLFGEEYFLSLLSPDSSTHLPPPPLPHLPNGSPIISFPCSLFPSFPFPSPTHESISPPSSSSMSLHFFPCYFLPPFFFFSSLGGLFKSLTFPSFFLNSLLLRNYAAKATTVAHMQHVYTTYNRKFIAQFYGPVARPRTDQFSRFAAIPTTTWILKAFLLSQSSKGGGEN